MRSAAQQFQAIEEEESLEHSRAYGSGDVEAAQNQANGSGSGGLGNIFAQTEQQRPKPAGGALAGAFEATA